MMNENLKRILRLDIKHPIDYWYKYWNYAVEELGKPDSLKMLLRTPRIIISDLLEEVSNEKIWIKENIELFRKELNDWNKDDKAFNNVFGADVSLLSQNLDNQSKKPLLKQLCKSILQEMDKGKYFDALVGQIRGIVIEDAQITYELKTEINNVTISMITELLSKGYGIEDLKGMSDGVPNVIFAEGHIVIAAPSECCELRENDFEDKNKYEEALTKKIQSRAPEEVVEGLKSYYYREPFEKIVLFRIEGLRGDVDIKVGEINFYCPCSKKYLKSTECPFNKIEDCSRKYVNAAVPVRALSPNRVVEIAKDKLVHAIQLITLLEMPSHPINISGRYITTINREGDICGKVEIELDKDENERAKMKENSRYLESEDMSKLSRMDEIKKKTSLLQYGINSNSRRLYSSLHWLDKCEHTDSYEEKLLFAWIALENLMDLKSETLTCLVGTPCASTRDIVKTITSMLIVENEHYSRKKLLFENLYYSYHYYHNYYEIPQQVADDCELSKDKGEMCDLKKFSKHLAELEDNVNDEIMRSDIHELNEYYNNVSEGIKERCRYYENLITILYRLRNMEVHHASHSSLIRYYVPFMVRISQQIVYVILDEYSRTGESIDDIFIRRKMEFDKLLLSVKK